MSLDDARRTVLEELVGTGATVADRVGLESEVFAMHIPAGEVGDRARLFGPGGAVEIVEHTRLGRMDTRAGNPTFDLGGRGGITFEPGAQIEHATNPRDSVSEAIDDVVFVRSRLTLSAADLERRIVACGRDPWHLADDIPQFLPGPRYKAMADYFHSKGHAGPDMMQNTAALQINLDGGSDLLLRYRTANLLSPLLTATFASSPARRIMSRRARTWQQLDPTRTGFPDLREPSLDSLADWCLMADVMFRWEAGDAVRFPPGVRLIDWVQNSGSLRPPTVDDVRYHLTTLFPEVRLRHGVLELRAIDTLPSDTLAAPIVLVVGALYDHDSLRRISEILEPIASRVARLWRHAAISGLHHPELFAFARAVWPIALAGARRLHGSIRAEHLADAAAFLARFTDGGNSPASVMATLEAPDRLDLCMEPVPSTRGSQPVLATGRAET